MNKHEHGEDDEMQASQGFRQTFMVSCEPAKAIGPAEAAFHISSSAQKNEAFLGFWQSNHLQLYAFIARRLCRLFTGVALVCKGNLHGLAACTFYLLRQFLDLSPLFGCSAVRRSQFGIPSCP